MCVRQIASPKSHLSRRVSVSLSPRALGPHAKDSKRAFARRTVRRDRSRSDGSQRGTRNASRSEKRSGIVMLSTNSRSRHSLSILYILSLSLSLSQTRSFVTFRFVCVSFFSCVYLPLKVAGGCTAHIFLNDSMIFLSFVRTLDERVLDCPRSGPCRRE